MNDEALNMSIRKFLKTVGISSQIAVEKAVHKAITEGRLQGNEAMPVTMTLSVGTLSLNLTFEGELTLS